jgi:hypothetical protein
LDDLPFSRQPSRQHERHHSKLRHHHHGEHHGQHGQQGEEVSSAAVAKLATRLQQVEANGQEVLALHEALERRVSSSQFNRATIENLKKDFEQLKADSEVFGKWVTDQLIISQRTETEHAIQSFRARWTTVVPLISPLELVHRWIQFVRLRKDNREALEKIKAVYSRRHVGSRVHSWNYISQKCLSQMTMDRIENREEVVETQLETLAAIVRKRERSAVEQAKDVQSRISTMEKKIETQQAKKADQTSLEEMIGVLETRIDQEVEPEKLKKNITDLWGSVKSLETSKTDVKMTERNGKRMNELTMELRQSMQDHDAAIQKCATYEDLSVKANATIVEQVCVMLAQQADQLARLVASDLTMFKQTLGRFLELSPDVRKAALSLGLQENETCMTCRKLNRKLVEPLSGTDGNLYRISPESYEAMGAETQRVVNEKIKFPSQLMCSMVAGNASGPFGDSWLPICPQASPDTTSKLSSKASAKIFNPDAVDQAEHHMLLSRIRSLVNKDAGWLNGPDLRTLAGTDTRRKLLVKDSSSDHEVSRPSSSLGDSTISGSAGKRRPQSSGRSFFPASAMNENSAPRSLFKDVPQLQKKAADTS